MLCALRSVPFLLTNSLLEFFLVHGFLIFLSFYCFLDCTLVSEDILIELLLGVVHVLGIELPLLPDHLEPPVHVSELEVRASCRTDVPVLIDGGAENDAFAEQLGHLLVSHGLRIGVLKISSLFLM